MAGFGKQRSPHTEGDTISDLDGIHTLTCALMLLNTDLHGHVSRGGRKGVCPPADPLHIVLGLALSPAPFPTPACWPWFFKQTWELGDLASRLGPVFIYLRSAWVLAPKLDSENS